MFNNSDAYTAMCGFLIACLLMTIVPARADQPNPAGKRTGFFHVERAGDTWWVIDPQGNRFYIVGTDHVNYNVHWCEKLGYAPYHKNIEAIYGSEEKWADTAVARLKSWGFNSLAANNSPSTRHKGLAHMEFLAMGQDFSGVDYIAQRIHWTGFPNVFSPKWKQFCDDMAKKKCAPIKDDPQVIGYFIDNELEWYGKTGSLFTDTFAKPADHTAKIALVNLLTKRYHGDVKAFNAAWGTRIASFDELLKLTDAPKSATEKAQADVLTYIKLVADKYLGVTSAAIRKHDPNHMVLGCRFAGSAPDVWDVAGKYCDIVSVNCYRTLDLEKGVLTDGFEDDLATWHRKAKRPLMITEWSFPALDAGLPSLHGAGQRVPTQKDRARAFTIFQRLLFATPFVVGSDYFMWVDEPELGIAGTFPEDSNYGLVDVNDKPYALLTEAATNLHARVYDIHSGNIAEIYAKPGGKQSGFVVGNSGKAAARCKVKLWVDGRLGESAVDLAPGKSVSVGAPKDFITKPGGHLLVCRIEPEDLLLESSTADNESSDLVYVPGSPAPSAKRTPILVANPTDRPVESAVVSVTGLTAIANLQMLRVRDAAPSDIPCQVVGDEVLLALDRLGARECATLFAFPGSTSEPKPAVGYGKTDNGFEIRNGVLTLVKFTPGGNAFDRVEFNGTEVGSFVPLIYQVAGRDFWVRPTSVEDVEVNNGPAALVLDMTFVYRGERTASVRPHDYRAKYRFTIASDKPYFSSRLLWIENADAEPWLLQSYFHYALSNIAGDASDDRSKLTYWLDEKAGLCYGAVPQKGFTANFWKDESGAEHADVFRYPLLAKMLQPGERFTADDEPVYMISGDEATFQRTAADLRRAGEMVVQVRKAETP